MEGLIFGILRYGEKCSPYSGWCHAIRGELRDSELAFSWKTGHKQATKHLSPRYHTILIVIRHTRIISPRARCKRLNLKAR